MLACKDHIAAGEIKLDESVPVIFICVKVLAMPNNGLRNIDPFESSPCEPQRPFNIVIKMEVDFFQYPDLPHYSSLYQKGTAGEK